MPKSNRTGSGRSILYAFAAVVLAVLLAWGSGFRSGSHRQPGSSAESPASLPEAEELQTPASSPAPALATIPLSGSAAHPSTVSSASSLPPSAALPAPTGGVALSAEPEQAQLELRHRSSAFRTTASSPVTLQGLPLGEYEIIASHPGYRATSCSLTVAAGEVTTLPRLRLEAVAPPADGSSSLPPPTSPAPSGTGSLVCSSEPAGAEVWLTGEAASASRSLGVTPVTLASLAPGSYTLEFRQPPRPARVILVDVKPGATAQARASWNTWPLSVTSSPPGAKLQVDGENPLPGRAVITPAILDLREGRHEIRATFPGLEAMSLPVFIGETAPEPLQITFRHASLRLTSAPDGVEVYSGATLVGKTPLHLPALAPGPHHFLLRQEGHARSEVNLVLRHGEERSAHTVLPVNPLPEHGFSFTNGQGLRMVWIPALHGWSQATEMTQAVYEALMHENPSEFAGPGLPVENVTWAEAFRFCEKLTVAEQSRGFLPHSYHYTLPTDAQWSILAAGSTADQAVHSLVIVRESTALPGTLRPSPLGISDAIGNVWEWCLDWYSPAVLDRAIHEGSPGEPEKAGATHKVLRGGSWNRSVAHQLQVSTRRAASPTQHKDYETGFRVVLIPISRGN